MALLAPLATPTRAATLTAALATAALASSFSSSSITATVATTSLAAASLTAPIAATFTATHSIPSEFDADVHAARLDIHAGVRRLRSF